jgi:hypothetical protein
MVDGVMIQTIRYQAFITSLHHGVGDVNDTADNIKAQGP